MSTSGGTPSVQKIQERVPELHPRRVGTGRGCAALPGRRTPHANKLIPYKPRVAQSPSPDRWSERLLSLSEIRVEDPLPPRGLPAQTVFFS